MSKKKPISTRKQSNPGPILLLIGIPFVGIASWMLWSDVVKPQLELSGAKNWVSTDCEITHSEVDVKHGDENDSYRPIVEYQYEYEGQKHNGDRIDFASQWRESSVCREIVRDNRPGDQTTCSVNPAAPDESVLFNQAELTVMGVLFPSMFGLVGLGTIFGAIASMFFKKKEQPVSSSASSPKNTLASTTSTQRSSFTSTDTSTQPGNNHYEFEADVTDRAHAVPLRLKNQSSLMAGLIFLAIFATLWNGFIGFFIWNIVAGANLQFDWFLLLFMIPFVLAGVAMIFGVIYMLLALFNPKIEIALSSGTVPLGGTVDVAWEMEGNASKIKNLTIALKAKESATYRRGTDTVTDNEDFFEVVLLESNNPEEFEFGSREITIPAHLMHTFEAPNNKIIWYFTVVGEIPWWPDVKSEYPFRVSPS